MRHFHRGDDTLIRNGKIYFAVAEGVGLFVCSDGTFITRFRPQGDYRGRDNDGNYLRLTLKQSGAYAHRIVYEVCTNVEIPEGAEIDHVNGNGFDNRLENLRIVYSRKENMKNPHTQERQTKHLSRLHRDSQVQDRKRETWKKKRGIPQPQMARQRKRVCPETDES